MSVPPPAANGTTILIVRVCDQAVSSSAANAATTAITTPQIGRLIIRRYRSAAAASAADLRLQCRDLLLAARREHADLAAARIGHHHLQRLARTFEHGDVARLGPARRQVEQGPLVCSRIPLRDLVGAPQVGP